ncbi:LacI family DNA-binding transcriptional regulator [Dactylosporangium sucinum]|uniref:LacI family transcriptional regulator n=1 Tax=Dactylosporangium sucinum TaxID=1424081 RepID=A0A917UD49_9ACTN|nr:LacI family DNA-binding transcriptional regulator [Dactylosporangium sucinum]GGM80022.1 LacI family transcriptional regulator [Dactylosporangium sucinum]
MAGDGEHSEAPRRTGRPTIKDVALLAGVSWRTVSNVIHGHKYLRAETRAKVEAAISELGYRPQQAARQLRSGRSELLTLAVPYIAHPYFARLAHAVAQEAERHGYDVLIDETRGIRDRELHVAAGYRKILTDGIIFSPITIDRQELEAARNETPIVLLGEHIRTRRIDSVMVDNVASIRALIDHLAGLGRRRIAFLGYVATGGLGSSDLRVQGYREGLSAAGLDVDPAWMISVAHGARASTIEGDYSREAGYERTREFLPRIGEIDALVCANDLLAIGALRALREAGVRVPADVAVTGWDDIPDGAYAAPALTTVAPDLEGIARLAVRAVLRRLDTPDARPRATTAKHRLVLRDSTA